MKNLLTEILTTLDSLNNYTDGQIITRDELAEEFENISDFENLNKRLKIELNKLNNASSFNRMETKENLCELHVLIINYYWHIDQPKMMIEKFVGKYRDCINKKALANDDE